MQNELLAFFNTGRLIIPIIIDDLGEQALSKELRQFQWVDFRGSYDDALQKLLLVFPSDIKSSTLITPTQKQSKGYVFISYAEEDSDFVEQLRGFLGKQKYGYWDYAESDRNYHTQFVRELEGVIIDAAATKARWQNPQQIKEQCRSASVLKGGRVVFNIGGNKYRLILAIDYRRQACYVNFVGTHSQYDAIDAENG